jgi:branched-chain amino acid transport system substrate-binding protein
MKPIKSGFSVISRRGALVGMVAGLLFSNAAMAQQGVTDSEILIGAFGPLTGPASWVGAGSRDGLAVAVDEINKNGGVDGRKLRLIFEDAVKPAESIAAAKKLTEQDKVSVLILGSGSTGAEAAGDYLRGAGIPSFNIVGVTPKIRVPFSRNIFHGASPSSDEFASSWVDVILQQPKKPKKVAILVGSYALPQASLKSLQPRLEAAGVEITSVERYEQGDKDFTAQLVPIARTKPDLVVFLGHYTESALAIKQAAETGLAGLPWFVGAESIVRAFPKIAGPNAEGAQSTWLLPYFYTENEKPIVDFNKKWATLHGKPPEGRPNYVDVLAYGDMYIVALALRKAGKDLSWDNIINSWESLKDAKPSDFGPFASDIIFPETFSDADHQGNKKIIPIVVKNGDWRTR